MHLAPSHGRFLERPQLIAVPVVFPEPKRELNQVRGACHVKDLFLPKTSTACIVFEKFFRPLLYYVLLIVYTIFIYYITVAQ